ncbi:MAG: FemAB family XrtA/PEP-CTERM system-associated protein [Parahaliea sp.]
MSLRVRPAVDSDAAAWDDFVKQAPEGTFCHRFGWSRVLQRAFGHRSHYLVAEDENKLVGILPLIETRSLIFGHSLSSLPFGVYGGELASSASAGKALREYACEMATKLAVGALELRSTSENDSGWPSKDLYYSFRKVLEADHEVNLKNIPNRQRAMIRKGIGEGLTSEETDNIARLYRVYAESVRNLGTPVFSMRYLQLLKEEFGEDCRILMITDQQGDVAGVMNFYHCGEVLPYYGGSIARARSIKGCNHFMYWELMRRSVDEGILGFDFGRSKIGTGPFSFKKNFGFEPSPLPYEYFLVKAEQMPNLSPTNPKYSAMINIWQRLPLWLANRIGPLVAGSLG